jgi:riboflavin kinase / FMN adenylyltransferase
MPFRVFRSLEEVPADFGPSVVTIGNFDGVHAGHRELMRRAGELSREHGSWRPSVLTFDPHPSTLVAPARAPKLLTSMETRLEQMRDVGIRQVFILPFTWDVAHLSPEAFTSRLLVEAMKARAVVVGDNFRFGHKQSGDTARLKELGELHGFRTEVVGSVTRRGRIVSSTEIRMLLGAGNVTLANRLLERPYSLTGSIIGGHGVGRSRTVPTLNLQPPGEVLPAQGVYITRASDADIVSRQWEAVTNVGIRPTFQNHGHGHELAIETFLLSPFDGVDPKRIRLEFLRRLREERKFDSPEELKAQILRDVSRAHAFFRRSRVFC